MAITIIPVSEQAKGQFNGGEILENKPIGFPQDGGKGKPYSTLFYWAHAWSDMGSTIGEHPHRGFEIITYVIKGTIEHYDSQQMGWNTLETGAAQVIRAGNGISHAEKLHAGAEIFQIWLDPNIANSITQPASYEDLPPDRFTTIKQDSWDEKPIAGYQGPMELGTEGVVIKELTFSRGKHRILLVKDSIYSVFQLEGDSKLLRGADPVHLTTGDFAIIENENTIEIEIKLKGKYFVIQSPQKPKYTTYAEMQ